MELDNHLAWVYVQRPAGFEGPMHLTNVRRWQHGKAKKAICGQWVPSNEFKFLPQGGTLFARGYMPCEACLAAYEKIRKKVEHGEAE